MLTEALKCEIEILDKMTDARIMKWWFDYIPNESKYIFYYQKPNLGKSAKSGVIFSHYSLTLGLNRLMREIKAYSVVE